MNNSSGKHGDKEIACDNIGLSSYMMEWYHGARNRLIAVGTCGLSWWREGGNSRIVWKLSWTGSVLGSNIMDHGSPQLDLKEKCEIRGYRVIYAHVRCDHYCSAGQPKLIVQGNWPPLSEISERPIFLETVINDNCKITFYCDQLIERGRMHPGLSYCTYPTDRLLWNVSIGTSLIDILQWNSSRNTSWQTALLPAARLIGLPKISQ